MRIGIDASRAAVAQRTGTEHYSYQVIRRLLALAGETPITLYYNQPPPPGLFAGGEARVIPFPRLWTHLRLSWEMLLRPPDALFVPAHVLPPVRPRRTVVTVHDLGYLYHPEAHTRFARWYLDLSTRWNARVATQVIADSEATRRDLIRFYHTPATKIVVVYPGVGREFAPVTDAAARRAARERYGLPEGYILYVGTLQPRKNLARLVQAFAMLCQNTAAPDLVIAGKKGWLYDEIYRQVSVLGLERRVHFPGYVAQDDLPALLSGARCFALPSLYEGFGLPVLEAMACGTPVVCSNVSALPEVAGDAALLVDPTDTAALAEALRVAALDEGRRQRLIAAGRAQAARFSWERCAREIWGLLANR